MADWPGLAIVKQLVELHGGYVASKVMELAGAAQSYRLQLYSELQTEATPKEAIFPDISPNVW